MDNNVVAASNYKDIIAEIIDLGDIPAPDWLVEGSRQMEHSIEAGCGGHVPVPNRLVERGRGMEHSIEIFHR